MARRYKSYDDYDKQSRRFIGLQYNNKLDTQARMAAWDGDNGITDTGDKTYQRYSDAYSRGGRKGVYEEYKKDADRALDRSTRGYEAARSKATKRLLSAYRKASKGDFEGAKRDVGERYGSHFESADRFNQEKGKWEQLLQKRGVKESSIKRASKGLVDG